MLQIANGPADENGAEKLVTSNKSDLQTSKKTSTDQGTKGKFGKILSDGQDSNAVPLADARKNLDDEIRAAHRRWCAGTKTAQILIDAPMGVGKTHITIEVARFWFAKHPEVRIVHAVTDFKLIDQVVAMYGGDAKAIYGRDARAAVGRDAAVEALRYAGHRQRVAIGIRVVVEDGDGGGHALSRTRRVVDRVRRTVDVDDSPGERERVA